MSLPNSIIFDMLATPYAIVANSNGSNNYPNNLPQKSQNKVLFSFDQIVSVNVDDVAADRLGWVQSERQVFYLRVDRVGFLVEGAFVDGVRTRMINHFAEAQSDTIKIYD